MCRCQTSSAGEKTGLHVSIPGMYLPVLYNCTGGFGDGFYLVFERRYFGSSKGVNEKYLVLFFFNCVPEAQDILLFFLALRKLCSFVCSFLLVSLCLL